MSKMHATVKHQVITLRVLFVMSTLEIIIQVFDYIKDTVYEDFPLRITLEHEKCSTACFFV